MLGHVCSVRRSFFLRPSAAVPSFPKSHTAFRPCSNVGAQCPAGVKFLEPRGRAQGLCPFVPPPSHPATGLPGSSFRRESALNSKGASQ